jgi:hypothetical protein
MVLEARTVSVLKIYDGDTGDVGNVPSRPR